MSGITSVELTKNVEALDDYFEEVGDAFEVKVPRLVQEATELAEKAGSLKDNASKEFEALAGFKMMESISKTTKLVGEVPKIP